MKFIFFVFLFVAGIVLITDASGSGLLYSAGDSTSFQYPHHIPYAIGYSYVHSPYLLPYAYNVKHHHPDHKENDDNNDGSKITDNTAGNNKKMNENGKLAEKEKISQADNTNPNLKFQQQLGIGSFVAGSSSNNAGIGAETVMQIPQTVNGLKYYTFSYPITYTIPTPLYWKTSSQFHHQDGLGHYYYGYTSPDSSKQELKADDGITRGAYTYIDPEGKMQTVYYLSDENGFRVLATNLPKAPEPVSIPDSPEIAKAKEEHFKAQKEALERLNEAINKSKIN